MSDSRRNDETDPRQKHDYITIVIEGEEDLTVIDNPPGFPTKEELEMLVGVGGTSHIVEIEESEGTAAT